MDVINVPKYATCLVPSLAEATSTASCAPLTPALLSSGDFGKKRAQMARFMMRPAGRAIVNEDQHKAAQSKASCAGGFQAITATLWLTALTVAFTTTLGGLAGVEECLKKEISPPPPRPPPPPPPPSPHPPAALCNIYCRISHGDGRCQPICNTQACAYDGGDCKPHATTSSHPTTTHTTTLNDLLHNIAGPRTAGRRAEAAAVQRPGRRLPIINQKRAESYSYDSYDSYDGGDSYDSYDDEEEEAEDDEEDEDKEDEREEPDFLKRVTREVIGPMLTLVGIFGFLGALCSLTSGLFSLCGAASSSRCLLRSAAFLAGIAAIGGLLLTVGSGVAGGLLASGGEMMHVVLEREFPIRAARCHRPISHYALYVGSSLLGLAVTCALGACAAVANLDAACKLAAVCAVSGPSTDTSEQLSLVAGSTPGFSTPGTSGGGRGARSALAQRRKDDERSGGRGGSSELDRGLAMGVLAGMAIEEEGSGAAPLRTAPEDTNAAAAANLPVARPVAPPEPPAPPAEVPPTPSADNDPFPPIVMARPLQPPPACGASDYV